MRKLLPLIILSLMFASCASTYQYTRIASPGTEDMATIYVVRPSSLGSAVKFIIYEDDKLIGRLGPKSYLAWHVKPGEGEITIMSKSENKDVLVIQPRAGQTYFIEQKVKMGIAIARTELILMDETEGRETLKKLKAPKLDYAEINTRE